MKKKIQNVILKALGIAIPVIAFAYVAEKIWQARFQLFEKVNPWHTILIIGFGGILYCADNLFLVFAWRRLIDWFGKTTTNWKISMKVYGGTQIAKYLPGNFVQFPSRHIMGTRAGLKHAPLMGAAIFEVIGLVTVSSMIYFLGNIFVLNQTSRLPLVIFVSFLALIFPFVIQVIFSRISVLREMKLFPDNIYTMYSGLLHIWIIYIPFFLVAGLVLWIAIVGLDGSWFYPPFAIIVSTYAIAWLVGTISPGMPGGLGVREAVSILILSRYLGESTSIAVTLLSRLATMVGDVLFYMFVRLIR